MSMPEKFNGRTPKLTPELTAQFCRWLEMSGFISVAAGMCGVHKATAFRWLARGEEAKSGRYREFYEAVTRARARYRLLLTARMKQCATGGIVELPCADRHGNPVRDDAGNIITAPKVLFPDSRLMMYLADRLIPTEVDEPEVQERPSKAEIEAEGARYVDLFYSSVKVLVDLGVPLPQIAPPAIETTAKKVEPADEEPK
jgi:hypothetical protein